MNPKKRTIHLDDHDIVLRCFAQVLKNGVADVNIESYSDSNQVFHLLVTSLLNNEPIDLFMTDFIHPGLNGYEMCRAVRTIERYLDRPAMPIMLLTVLDSSNSIVQKGLKDQVFNAHVSIDSSSAEIFEKIEALCSKTEVSN